ncbi:hypothetical protein, partial [Leucobacter chromiiresistens]
VDNTVANTAVNGADNSAANTAANTTVNGASNATANAQANGLANAGAGVYDPNALANAGNGFYDPNAMGNAGPSGAGAGAPPASGLAVTGSQLLPWMVAGGALALLGAAAFALSMTKRRKHLASPAADTGSVAE